MAINWSPTTAEEVVQNFDTLLATEPGTVPLARAMGVPQDVVDKPVPAAGALLQAAVFTAVRTYEPRAPLTKVTVASAGEGKIKVTTKLGDG